MAEYICSVCGEKFNEEEKNLTNDEQKCILHCDKRNFMDNDHELFKKKLKENKNRKEKYVLYFYKVCFPKNLKLNSNDLGTNQMSSLQSVLFEGCSFFPLAIFQIGNVKSMFESCTFYENWKNHTSNVTYKNCNFDNFNYHNEQDERITINNLQFHNCYFNELNFYNIEFQDELFVYDSESRYKKINNIILTKCVFNEKLILNLNDKERTENLLELEINKLDLTNSIFRNKVKIQFCKINKGNFYNTKFNDLSDFYQSTFYEVNFERTDFEGITVFSEVKFNCNVDFKYTKFLKHSIFRDTIITGYCNLRNSIFDADANFLDITSQERSKNKDNEYIGNPKDIKVANRETARIIKNIYDNSNNIIEANRFYKLEMREKEKELNITKNPFDWLVFKVHRWSSNHSQNWLLPLVWIFIISYLVTSIKTTYGIFETILYNIFIFGVFDKMANVINPFSIMTRGEILTFNMLFLKVIIAYLIYQFIVSIRQNTRRK